MVLSRLLPKSSLGLEEPCPAKNTFFVVSKPNQSKSSLLGGELPTGRKWVTTLVINGISGGNVHL